MRRASLQVVHDTVWEMELWHGTDCTIIPELLRHGLQPPADSQASEDCERSGGKHLGTTLCGTTCEHCCEPHVWDRCHMYGLGVYLADLVAKSHLYVRPKKNVYSLLRCRVSLGNPYCIRSDKKRRASLHNFCKCEDPRREIKDTVQPWSPGAGYDCFFVQGFPEATRGLGARCNEYIVFHPFLILPLYLVEYTLD